MTARTTTADAVRSALHGLEFPASKDDLAWTAERNGADAATVEALRSAPAEDYTRILLDAPETEPFGQTNFWPRPPRDGGIVKA